MSTEPNSEQAARIFLDMLVARAYDGVIQDITSLLESGPLGRKPPRELVQLYQWFQTLDDEGRANVLRIIQESVRSAVFGCLVLLDGASGGYPIKDKKSDFAIYLQAYEGGNDASRNRPEMSIRFNPPAITYDLHDLFLQILDERTQSRT